VVLTLLMLSWACGEWLDHRIERITPAQCAGPPC
jgi:hypothetical protein